mmetsp:Transcript_51581/g.159823  ORF Transcript_51581/g.159823 Transcript_51581/m.159823 type:complete len:236 (-) Transcript_51581:139-846(-)
MMRAPLLLTLMLLAAPSAAAEAAEDAASAALAADDECAAGDSQCALNALQLRGEQKGNGAAAPLASEKAASAAPVETPAAKEVAAAEEASAVRAAGLHRNASCDQDTSGSCMVRSCAASRGPATCSWGSCKCPTGWCSQHGRCFATPTACSSDPGGNCTSVLDCHGKTMCMAGKCVCAPGHCAMNGKCWPTTDTNGTCFVLGCDISRGPTRCFHGKCLCQDGYVAEAGVCKQLTR